MTFSLPAGVYATSFLKEILHTTEPDRHTGSEAGAVD
jgi:tRNA pseudouridine13 synthase